jgi:hypothetical protein
MKKMMFWLIVVIVATINGFLLSYSITGYSFIISCNISNNISNSAVRIILLVISLTILNILPHIAGAVYSKLFSSKEK